MALRLHQVLAVASGVTAETKKELEILAQVMGNGDLYTGFYGTYTPRAEQEPGKEPTAATMRRPPKVMKVRVTTGEVLSQLRRVVSRRWDVQRTVDSASALATADVVLRDGSVLLPKVPVRHLMYLEAELSELYGRLERLPVLDPSRTWPDGVPADGIRRSVPVETTSEDKVFYAHVLYEATKEHAAQVKERERQEVVGTWSTVFESGALSPDEKFRMLARLTEVREAVKIAREQANSVTAEDYQEGGAVLDYILGAS